MSERRDRRGLSPLARALLLHLLVSAAVASAGLLFFRSHIELPECWFHAGIGLPCIACGGTRAAYQLTQLHLRASFWYNPIPLLTAVCAGGLLLTEAALLLAGRKRALPQAAVPVLVILVALLAALFWALRLAGVFPVPEAVPQFLNPIH